MYVYNAVSTALANAFDKKKHNYIEKPISFQAKGLNEERLKIEFGLFAEGLKETLKCS